jgi:predicted dehydrogenase
MLSLVVVGAGTHYKRTLFPSIRMLQAEGLVKLVATVDLEGTRTPSPNHLLRSAKQQLSQLLEADRRFKNLNFKPLVYLAHAHDLHTPDAIDLISAGFRVAIEKPYSVSLSELRSLLPNIKDSQAFLAEYYLMTEAAPLLRALDLIAPHSFFIRERSLWLSGPKLITVETHGLANLIGNIRLIHAEIIEGSGRTGTFEGRGPQFADRRRGGGVIMDLGVHVLAPLVAIASLIGDLNGKFQCVESAVCREFVSYAKKLGISPEDIPETYSHATTVTSAGIPIHLQVAKYTPKQRNQRRLVIFGDGGEARLSMTGATLYVGRGDDPPGRVWKLRKRQSTKFVPVLRTMVESLAGIPSYKFNVNEVCYLSQYLALKWRRTSDGRCTLLPRYKEGAELEDISRLFR